MFRADIYMVGILKDYLETSFEVPLTATPFMYLPLAWLPISNTLCFLFCTPPPHHQCPLTAFWPWSPHLGWTLLKLFPAVWQKPLQYCKVISLQLIKINGKKNLFPATGSPSSHWDPHPARGQWDDSDTAALLFCLRIHHPFSPLISQRG